MHLDFERDIVEIQAQIDKLLDLAERRDIDVSNEVSVLRGKLQELKVRTYANLTPMEQVQVARHPQPYPPKVSICSCMTSRVLRLATASS